MADEFQESEVIFSDHDYHQNSPQPIDGCSVSRKVTVPPQHKNKSKKNEKEKKNTTSSLPVNVPEMSSRRAVSDDQLEEECDDEEMVPPHVIVGRRAARKMASSVQTGNGRKLKGRELKQVRNSILRMTGFLEK